MSLVWTVEEIGRRFQNSDDDDDQPNFCSI